MYINDEFEPRYEDVKNSSCNDGDTAENGQLHGCGALTHDARWGLKNYPLAMVYSPIQEWRELYDHDTALSRGTMFSELDLPFLGGKCDFGGGKNG